MSEMKTAQRELIRVSLRIGPFTVEAAGETDDEIQRKLKRGVSCVQSVLPIVQEIGSISVPSPVPVEAGGQIRESLPAIALSAGELIKKSDAKTETDRCEIVATYLFKHEMREFTHRDILKLYDESGIPRPSNIQDVLNRLTNRARLRHCGDREGIRLFTVTHSGVAHAESLTESQ